MEYELITEPKGNKYREFCKLCQDVYAETHNVHIDLKDKWDALSEFLLLSCDGRVIGGARFTVLSKLGLPMEEKFPNILWAYDNIHKLGQTIEVGRFVVHPDYRSYSVIVDLFNQSGRYVERKGIKKAVFITNNALARMYKIAITKINRERNTTHRVCVFNNIFSEHESRFSNGFINCFGVMELNYQSDVARASGRQRFNGGVYANALVGAPPLYRAGVSQELCGDRV